MDGLDVFVEGISSQNIMAALNSACHKWDILLTMLLLQMTYEVSFSAEGLQITPIIRALVCFGRLAILNILGIGGFLGCRGVI